MAITAAQVKELREMTGAGMMDCKKALAATEGDMDKAVEFLREKGLATAQKKASRIARLKEIETMEADGTFDVLPKKEVIELRKEMSKLQKNLGGIKEMKRIPDAIFIVDPKKERICVQEAHTLGIPLIGICDTNCDPEELDYVIPGNDDAIRAVKLIVSKMADAVIEANQGTTEVDGEIEAESEEFAGETTEE